MEAEKPAGKRPRTKYSVAFRAEAIRRVLQDERVAARIAQALGMSEALTGRWVLKTELLPRSPPASCHSRRHRRLCSKLSC